MVEFALVGGLFFFLVFAIVNAGFFLYGRSAVEHAADVGTATIAAEGQCMATGGLCVAPPSAACPSSTADDVAICRMDQQGLTTTALITVTEIDVWKEVEQVNGSFADVTTGCPGAGACEQQYDVHGNLLNPGGSGNGPWPPGGRTVNGASGPDFARLVIKFRYTLIATTGTLTMSTSNVFRLEPHQ